MNNTTKPFFLHLRISDGLHRLLACVSEASNSSIADYVLNLIEWDMGAKIGSASWRSTISSCENNAMALASSNSDHSQGDTIFITHAAKGEASDNGCGPSQQCDSTTLQMPSTYTLPHAPNVPANGEENSGSSPSADVSAHKLSYDRGKMQWVLGPYFCRVQLTPCLESADRKKNLNALTLTVYNNDPDRTLPTGEKMRVFSYDISSTLFPRANAPDPATDYDSALANLAKNRSRVESLLGCTFDFSELSSLETIRREFTRRAHGEILGDRALEF
jgi:hypothetical protein